MGLGFKEAECSRIHLHIAHIQGVGKPSEGITEQVSPFLESYRRKPEEPHPQRNGKCLQLSMGLWRY